MPLLPWFSKKANDEENESSSQLYRLSGMGIELAASVVGMTLVGWLLDRLLGTTPWLIVSFAVLGIVGGTYNFIKSAVRENRSSQARWRRSHPQGPSLPPDRPAPKPHTSATPPTQPPAEKLVETDPDEETR